MGISTEGLLFYGLIPEQEEDERIHQILSDLTEDPEVGTYCDSNHPERPTIAWVGGESSLYVICIRESHIAGDLYDPLKLEMPLPFSESWSDTLVAFCQQHSIPVDPAKIGWYLGASRI